MDPHVTATEHGQSRVPSERAPRRREAIPTEVTLRLASRLRLITGVGILLLIVGVVIDLVQVGNLPDVTVRPSDLPTLLGALDGDAIVTLGLLILLVAPAYGLVSLGSAFARQRDWLYAVLAGLVLAILGLSVVIALVTRGG